MKSVLYSAGEIKGGFEIIEKSRGVRAPNGNIRSIYLVKCLTCGSKVELDANQMRYRKDCGCVKAKKQKELEKYRNTKKKTIQKITEPWMTEEQIRREYKNSKNQKKQIVILAQLNGVKIEDIERIIRQ